MLQHLPSLDIRTANKILRIPLNERGVLMTIETLALSREWIHEVDLAKLCRMGLDDIRDALSQFLTDGYIVFGVNDFGATDLRFGSFKIIPFEREDGPEPGWLYGVSCSAPCAIK